MADTDEGTEDRIVTIIITAGLIIISALIIKGTFIINQNQVIILSADAESIVAGIEDTQDTEGM